MQKFVENVTQIWGEEGKRWLEKLPSICALLAKKWSLTDVHPAKNLSYNYIALCTQHGNPVALKIGFERKAIEQEAHALRVYNGHGCIKLLDVDESYNALLLEQAVPGTSLKTLFPQREDKAVEHAALIMQQLHAHKPLGHFPTVQDWLKKLEKPHPLAVHNYHIKKALTLSQELLASSQPAVLLHGDLHHDNILLSGSTWVAIDPKGVLGEPAYEVGAFIRNPYPELLDSADPAAIMQQRLKIFSDMLHIDYERLRLWSYVQAVLAGQWALEDGQTDINMAMMEATLLDQEV